MAHALLVGVSEYLYLPPVTQPGNARTFNLRRLGSSALSAWEICRWLVAHADSLACKLGTIRILMSPSEAELPVIKAIAQDPDGAWKNLLPTQIDPALWDPFMTEATEWRKDCATSNRDGLSFFYYSGHGLRRSGNDLVTLADFAKPMGGGKLKRTFELLSNFVAGMGPLADSPDIARNQFYFADCCRENILDISYPDEVWEDTLCDYDDRTTPVFMAAYPGDRAMAIRGQTTDFCNALLECLENGTDGPTADDKWPITSFSLSNALDYYFKSAGLGGASPCTGINLGNVPLRWRAGPPEVDYTLMIQPPAAVEGTSVTVNYLDGVFERQFPATSPDHPYKIRSPAGVYKITATPTGPFQSYNKTKNISRLTPQIPIQLGSV
ncbi:hypothetical protein B5K06_26170 [Rhizobium grahamii]|uniref:Caspase family protein n=2 Tax=Rhizobium grahamii TaxID=1120045 RepID=A0A370KHQ1_9HYPH|nr:hypothetical protein B5K06_26170 [Rhizobium grahamii]